MALNPKTAAARRNAALDTIFDTLNSGNLRVADSTQPTDADTALGAQVDLADCAFGATAFAAASAGSKAANSITQDSSINASGTASWGTLQATGFAVTGMYREARVRYTEVDEVDPSIRWQHRGGKYRICAGVS